MTNREYYKAAFSHIKAPEDAARRVLDAMPSRQAPRRRTPKLALAIAATIVLLMGTAAAELDNGGVSNLLAPIFGGARTELVNDIGHPIDAVCSANGYTVTADAVIGDRYNMYVAYTITRDDGQPLPEGIYFEELENSAHYGSGGGFYGPRPGEDGAARYVEEWSNEGPIIGRHAKVTFHNLMVYDKETGTRSLLAEGTWTLQFTLRYKDTTVKVPVAEETVTDEAGYAYEIRKIQLSALSLRVDMTAPAMEDGHTCPDTFTTALLMKDGTVVSPHEHNGGAHGNVGDAIMKSYQTGRFETPILLEEVQAVLICGIEYPLG